MCVCIGDSVLFMEISYFSFSRNSFSQEERGHVIAAFLSSSTRCAARLTELKARLRSSE